MLFGWLEEYSLPFGIVFCTAAIFVISNRVALALLLAIGVAFLLLSMVSAMRRGIPNWQRRQAE